MITREIAPKITDKIIFNLPDIEKDTLNCGSRLFTVIKKDLPIVQLNFVFSAGAKFDDTDKYGTSYLLSYLIDEGAGKYNALQLADQFENLGIIVGFGTDNDHLHFSLLSLKEHLDEAIELIGEVIKNPWLKDEEFEREKFKLTTRIMQSAVQPDFLANSLFEKAVFYNTPYANPVIGYSASVKNISLTDVTKFYKTHLTPKSMDIIAVGDFNNQELSNKLNNIFDDWKVELNRSEPVISVNSLKQKILLIDKPDSAQSEIRVGHITSNRKSPDHLARIVVNSILGGNFTSRLNSNLREEKGYTYGIRSSILFNQISGMLEINTSVDTENTINAINEIVKEFNGIIGQVKEEEIEFTKSFLSRRFPSLFESYSQISRSIGNLIEHNLELDYYNSYLDRLNSLTNDEIQKASIDNFKPDELVIAIVGNKKAFEKELNNFGNFEIIETDENLNF